MSPGGLKFDVFICYESTTALDLAKNLKESLKKCGTEAFVAEVDIRVGNDELWRTQRDIVLKKCKHFVAIITNVALTSDEVEKEINSALESDKNIIPCVEEEVITKLLQIKFPRLLDFQGLLGFKTSEELNRGVTNALIPYYLSNFIPKMMNVYSIVSDIKGCTDLSADLAEDILKRYWKIVKKPETKIFDTFKEFEKEAKKVSRCRDTEAEI